MSPSQGECSEFDSRRPLTSFNSMNDFIVRTAEEKDAPQIAKVQVETWQYAYKGQLPQEHLDKLSIGKRTKRWQEILSDKKNSNVTFVAKKDDYIVGFCSAGPCRDDDMDSETGEILSIYVDSITMRKGVGTELMEQGLDYLREKGFKKAILWVLVTNDKARQWYENRGWKCEGKIKEEIHMDTSTSVIRYLRKF